MDFDEVVVKESPGLCRCCLSEGCYKDMATEYNWMGDTEVYADMLLECFDLSVSQQTEGPNGPSRLICEVCITRLRDACNFKKQVHESETRFLGMVARGEFTPKVVFAAMKEEPPNQSDGLDVEYLDELDFTEADPEELLKGDSDPEEISVAPLPVKRGRGRPRKNPDAVVEKKQKLTKYDDKPKTSRAKEPETENLSSEPTFEAKKIRNNLAAILQHTSVVPFKWVGNNYRCFFCDVTFTDVEELKTHSSTEHDGFYTENILKHSVNLRIQTKLDVSRLKCKTCDQNFDSYELLTEHLIVKHEANYDKDRDYYFQFYKLNNESSECLDCHKEFRFCGQLVIHKQKEHNRGNLMCEECGLNFVFQNQLKLHIEKGHLKLKKYKCSVCGLGFANMTNKRHHESSKHGTDGFPCRCGEKFLSSYKLKRHKSLVHEEHDFECDQCNLKFFWKNHLVVHKNTVHLNLKVICPVCGERFYQRYLKTHMISHTDERPFECEFCKRCFARKKSLNVHYKTHSKKSRNTDV